MSSVVCWELGPEDHAVSSVVCWELGPEDHAVSSVVCWKLGPEDHAVSSVVCWELGSVSCWDTLCWVSEQESILRTHGVSAGAIMLQHTEQKSSNNRVAPKLRSDHVAERCKTKQPPVVPPSLLQKVPKTVHDDRTLLAGTIRIQHLFSTDPADHIQSLLPDRRCTRR